jgi:3-deoxy-manno-octulosonate cytidylyltransferase (CMP-KDO synthetase)
MEAVRSAERISRAVVATDDRRIFEVIESLGGEAVMTREDHVSGTDRIAEAVSSEKLNLPDDQIVVNVQGDEPEIPPECLDKLVDVVETSDAPMATLATPLLPDQADDPNKVKVVLRTDGAAMYFSRAKIPHDRDGDGKGGYLLHLGTYAYRVGFLKMFASLSPTRTERAEKLEQLRALENGYKIAVAVVEYTGAGIDTPEDYAQFVARLKGRGGAPK